MRRRSEKKANLRRFVLELFAYVRLALARQSAQVVPVELLPIDLLLVPAVARVGRATSAAPRPVRPPNFLHIDGA